MSTAANGQQQQPPRNMEDFTTHVFGGCYQIFEFCGICLEFKIDTKFTSDYVLSKPDVGLCIIYHHFI